MKKHIIIISPSSRLRKSLRVLLKSINSDYEFEERELIDNLHNTLQLNLQNRIFLDANLLETELQIKFKHDSSRIIVLAHTNEQCLSAQQNNFRNILLEEMTPNKIEQFLT